MQKGAAALQLSAPQVVALASRLNPETVNACYQRYEPDWPSVRRCLQEASDSDMRKRHGDRPLFLDGTLVVIALVAVFFTYLQQQESALDLVTPTFAASIALVALIVPAVGLAGSYRQRASLNWLDLLQQDSSFKTTTTQDLVDWNDAARPLLRGFGYAFLSAPLATVALFQFRPEILSIPIVDILIAVADALIVVAVLCFIPFTWRLLNNWLISQAMEVVKNWPTEERARAEPSATEDQAPVARPHRQ